MKKRILLVEDHTILRAGMRALLAQDTEVDVVGEADNGRDAILAAGRLKPDVILMDISMPGVNGIEASREIRRRYPEINILILTIYKTEEYIHESLKAGANGYILKDASPEELRTAIRTVAGGKVYISPDIASQVVSGFASPKGSPSGLASPWDTLTSRERQVLKLVAEGNSNKHIAEHLCLSVKTVEKHRSNLMTKLNLHNASALTSYAIEKGLVTTS